MEAVDKSQLDLDSTTSKYVADDLWRELNGIEEYYPQVLSDHEYTELRAAVVRAASVALPQQELKELYGKLFECLRRISTEPSGVVSLAARRDRPGNLSSYLPSDFKDFVNHITEARLQAEYYENAYQGTAEALFMREIKSGIEAVVPRHRDEVQDRIYEILVSHSSGEEIDSLDRADMEKILELMGIDDDIDLLSEAIDEGIADIGALILSVREEIESEYGDTDNAELKLKTVDPQVIEALESGLKRLFGAIAAHERQYGTRKELGRAHRMEFARRIVRPRLQPVMDKRPTFQQALQIGLTTFQAKILLMMGFIKPPGLTEEITFYPADARDESGRTLEEIEAGAVAHSLAQQFEAGRHRN